MSSSYKINNPDGVYFLTFATVGWVDVFTRKHYKDILVDSLKYCQENKGLELYSWCVMSNHVHLIAKSNTGDLSGTLRDLKSHTSKQLLKSIATGSESRKEWMLGVFKTAGKSNSNNTTYQLWRQDNQPKEVVSNHFLEQKSNYIHNNPVEAGIVEHAEDYLYSSARNYAGEKGLLDVEII